MLIFRTFLLILALLALSACGGGGGDDSPPPTNSDGNNNDDNDNDDGDEPRVGSRSGTFIDSAVGGITFTNEPSGITGTTNPQGWFTFEPGDTVTFSIGDLTLPPTIARGLVTPLTLAGSDDPNDRVATNIARLLQSLDSDGNASNGIEIASGAAEVATEVDFSADDFEDQVSNLVANSGSSNITLISAEEARAHLQSSLEEARTRIVGSWRYIDTSAADVEDQFVIVLTLMSDGRFAIINDEDRPEDDGFEVGDYEWNVNTGEVTLSNVRDYNGVIGLAGGDCDSEEDKQFTFDLSIGGGLGDDQLLLGADTGVGEGCDEEGDGSEVIVFDRVFNEEYWREGTWKFESQDEFVLLHLQENGLYTMLQEAPADSSGQTGIERGEYTLDQDTGAVVFTQDTDTNGEWGFSHPCPGLARGELDCMADGSDTVTTFELGEDPYELVMTNRYDTEQNGGVEAPVRFDRVGPLGVDLGNYDIIDLDLSGTWTFDIDDHSDVAECEDDRTEEFVIVQTGTDLAVTDSDGNSYEGSLTESGLNWSGSYREDGGTTEVSLEGSPGLVDTGLMSMFGTSTWSFTLDGESEPSCSGESSFNGTRN